MSSNSKERVLESSSRAPDEYDTYQLRAKLLQHFSEEDLHASNQRENDEWMQRMNLWEHAIEAVKNKAVLGMSFISSLSSLQLELWRALDEWWTRKYHSFDLKANFDEWKQGLQIEIMVPRRSALGLMGQKTYFWCLSGLFHQEIIDEVRPRSKNADDRDPLTGFTLAWFWSRVSVVRKTSMAYASMQRISFAAYRWVRNPEYWEPINQTPKINLEVCPWLEEPHKNPGVPFYLWEIGARHTVLTQDIGDRLEYTCISHTWGRWRSGHSTHIAGVPWEVPQVSRYTVEELPELFAKQIWPTKYLWFDLFCIPQDESLRASIEISKQASIFRKATKCIIWMNDVEMWAGMELGLVYFGLLYLKASQPGIPVDECWTKTNELSDRELTPFHPVDQLHGSGNAEPGWLSSLWTLQEAILCPRSLLADRHLRLLTYKAGITATLESVVFYIRVSLEVYHYHKDAWGLPPRALTIFKAFNLPDLVEASRMGPFIAGNFRQCTSHRAEAIMSVMGVTDWYMSHIEAHGSPPDQQNLVAEKYPLEFVRETADKLGAAFYFFWQPSRTTTEDRTEVLGPGPQSILPLLSRQSFPGEESISPLKLGDTIPHMSIFSWVITVDAKVHIKNVAVIGSSEWDALTDGDFRLNRGGGWESHPSLQRFAHGGPAGRLRVFVSLCQCQGSQLGLLLESLYEGQSSPVSLRKTGIFLTTGAWAVPETAVEKSVDWLVA